MKSNASSRRWLDHTEGFDRDREVLVRMSCQVKGQLDFAVRVWCKKRRLLDALLRFERKHPPCARRASHSASGVFDYAGWFVETHQRRRIKKKDGKSRPSFLCIYLVRIQFHASINRLDGRIFAAMRSIEHTAPGVETARFWRLSESALATTSRSAEAKRKCRTASLPAWRRAFSMNSVSLIQ